LVITASFAMAGMGKIQGAISCANVTPVPSLAGQDVQAYSDGQLKWILYNGIFPSEMPGSKGVLSDEGLWQVVAYLRHLPPARSLGEPNAYTGDEYGGEQSASSQQTNSAQQQH
jgi:hypothetical protein